MVRDVSIYLYGSTSKGKFTILFLTRKQQTYLNTQIYGCWYKEEEDTLSFDVTEKMYVSGLR